MHIYRLQREMLAPVSIREAFSIFENPHNLLRITPPWLDLRVTSQEPVEMRKGAEIHYRLKVLGIPLGWKTVIIEYEPPFFFIDIQEGGPYRYWRHTHTFRPTPEGTRVFDEVEYALPLGPLGRLAHRLFVARQLEEIFRYRQTALAELFAEFERSAKA